MNSRPEKSFYEKGKKLMGLTIGKRKGTPRPHLRTHPAVLAQRWTPENHPKGGRKKKTVITQALTEILNHRAIVNGTPTDLTCAEVIAKHSVLRAMNPELGLPDTELILDRTEGKAKQAVELSGPGGKEITFRVIFDDDDGESISK
jgi:hypothetical protein